MAPTLHGDKIPATCTADSNINIASTIFVDKRKKNELEILGQKIETEKLLNLLGHIAYLKRLCFNMQGVKASDISDLIFSNAIKEIL